GRLGERIEIELKANDCGRRVSLHRQTVDTDGKHREEIAMWVIAWRRAGPAIAGCAEIRARLQGACGQFWRVGIAGIEGKRARAGWDVDDEPVPEPAAGRRVGIKTGQGEALGTGWRPRPSELRRFVAAGAAEPEIGGKHMICA